MTDTKKEEQPTLAQQRVALNKVVIDTPSLLNMIKHCQDNKTTYQARGQIMGMLKSEIGETNLFVTQTLPEVNKNTQKTMKQLLSDLDDASNENNNEIGFYVNCELGLAFTSTNLVQMIVAYRNFRNSVMVVYDVNKSAYGCNPLTCYRLSESAINALSLNDPSKLTDKLVQDSITANSLSIESFFEQVNLKIYRSHLLQAFLFDHIQPHMPAFNTHMFTLGASNNLLTH